MNADFTVIQIVALLSTLSSYNFSNGVVLERIEMNYNFEEILATISNLNV